MTAARLALAAGILALAACASADKPDGGGRGEPVRALLSADAMMFVGFDADGDLSVTASEIQAGTTREFARADTSGDGQIQPLEFQTWANAVLGGGQIGPFRLDFDRNVDNVITREEFEAEIRARVGDYDSDENGVLTRPEFVRLVGQTRSPPARLPSEAPGP